MQASVSGSRVEVAPEVDAASRTGAAAAATSPRAASLRVLVVLHTPRDRHSAVYLAYTQLAEFAAAAGHRVTVLTPEAFPLLARIHARWRPFLYPVVVDRWLQRHGARFDVVVFHSYAGWLAALRPRRPFVVVTAFHGLEPLFYRALLAGLGRYGRRPRGAFRLLHGWLVPAMARMASRRSARVLCLNRTEARYLVAEQWADPHAVVVMRHGVAQTFFAARTFAARVSTLAFVGQWLERKGIADLTEAFASLVERSPWLRLSCAGTLVGREQVLASYPPGVRERVDVFPRLEQDELARLLARADLFVLPSQFEGCSRALLEAMAAALPIVTTPVGAAPELLVADESAVFVPVGDSQALACAIEQLIDDRGRRERLGRAAQQRAARWLALDRVNEEWLNLLLEVARERTAVAG
jgi:glycosyltransferase involved in cell wall biosynthesis